VLLKRLPFVGIQVEEEEQKDTSNTSGGSMESLGHAVSRKNYLCVQINPEAPEKGQDQHFHCKRQ
jgi:hypothetical protein